MKATILIKKLLGASVATKSRTGFLVAIIAIITVGEREALNNIDLLSSNDTLACIGVGLLGALTWITGRLVEAKRVESVQAQNGAAEEAGGEHPLTFLRSLQYWGLILILSAGTLSCLATWRRHKPALVVHARPLPVMTITVTNVVLVTNEAPRLVFPSLELQGVVVNGAKSSAVINGHVLCLGEGISNAVLVAVDSEHAFVALEGQTKVLALRK
jgi:hypothetical protein